MTSCGSPGIWLIGAPNLSKPCAIWSDIDDSIRVVLGNHDLHFIAIFEGCARASSKDSLDELLEAPDCEALCDWMRQKDLAYYDSVDTRTGIENFLMAHAGVAPGWSLKKTLKLAAEVELALQGPDYREFLTAMYGNEPIRWSDKLTGQDRLRTITNYLTRVRFCDDIGSLQPGYQGRSVCCARGSSALV